jgi:hypothetical protein
MAALGTVGRRARNIGEMRGAAKFGRPDRR